MSTRLNQFLGDTPFRVFIRLVALSFVVGLIMSVLDLYPLEIFNWLKRLIERIYEMGFEIFREALEYLVLGAMVVVPVFLIMRIVKMGSRRG